MAETYLKPWLGRRRVGSAYAAGALAAGLGLVVRLIGDPFLDGGTAFLFFVPAPLLAAALGGVWPGGFATAVGFATALALVGRDGALSPGDAVNASLYVALGAAVSLGGEWYQRARERLETAHAQLLRDVEEGEAAEARFQALQAELIHVSRLTALGEMASSLAHELNQPLAAVSNYLKGSARLIRAEGEPPRDKLLEAIGKAGDQAMRAGEIIRRMRDFVARGETERRPEGLSDLLREAAALALLGAEAQGVDLVWRLDPTVERVLCDRVQVQQVVLNLIRNALEAMDQTPRKRLEIRTEADGDLARVSVIDTGAGVSPEITGQLFQPFVTTKRTGMGVGLSISRTIVEAHGGRIWAEPAPGGGTAFRFTLPAVDRKALSDVA